MQMILFDMLGNKIKAIELNKNNETISTKTLAVGNYFAVFSVSNKIIAVNKFVHF